MGRDFIYTSDSFQYCAIYLVVDDTFLSLFTSNLSLTLFPRRTLCLVRLFIQLTDLVGWVRQEKKIKIVIIIINSVVTQHQEFG